MFKKLLFALFCMSSFLMAAVNLNTASKAELMTIKGIGDKKAEAIIEYRQKNGPFKSTEEIKKVSGIGDKIYESIKADIIVDTKKETAKTAKAK